MNADGGPGEPCGGSTGSGGSPSDAGEGPGLGFAGTTAVAGAPSTGGAVSTGCGLKQATGYLPSVIYCGPTANLGNVTCASWMNADPTDPTDPRAQVPDWGYYLLNNPTSSARNDVRIKIGVAPLRADSTILYSFFNTVYLYFAGLPADQPFYAFSLDGVEIVQEYETDDFGVVWLAINEVTTPGFVVDANSTREFRLASSLCPYFPSSTTDRAIPAKDTQLRIFVLGILYLDELPYALAPEPDPMTVVRTFEQPYL